jgi:nucleotide-binding universal stress UspA family protein
MYKKILVPLDGSKRAEKILPRVEDLALHYKSKVIFLMAIQYFQAAAVEGSFAEFSEIEFSAQLEKAKSYLKGVMKTLRQKDIKTQTVVAMGPAAEKIIQIAKEKNVDLIAMASHGCGGLTGDLDGGSASELANFLVTKQKEYYQIFINTAELKDIYPFGVEVLQHRLLEFEGQKPYIIFIGKNMEHILN